MAIALVDSEAVGFNDGNGGHVYTFPTGAPAVGDLDVLCVNSNTVVSTPSGFTARVSAVANQGAYIFTRKASGGESSSVTVTTSGNENTTLTWSRWSGTDSFSAANSAQANNSNDTVLPAASTGTLAATGMLVVAFGALHNHDAALAASPSWSNSFNPLEQASQGAAGASSSCVAFTAYKTGVGTAAETINSVSWTNNVRNRYALWVAFTAAAGGTTHNADAAVTSTAGRTATAALALPAAAALTTTAARTTAAAVVRPATAALTVTAGRAVTAANSAAAQATLTTTASIAAAADVGVPPVEAQASVTATGVRTATAAVDRAAAAALTVTSARTTAAIVARAAAAGTSVAATLTAEAARVTGGTASLSALATITVAASVAGDIIFRPNAGTITRPNIGTILRP